jgi:hypothetical protein
MRGRLEEIPACQNKYAIDSANLVADSTLLHTSYKTKQPKLKLELKQRCTTPAER